RLLETFDTQVDAGLVGAKLIFPDGRMQESGGIVFRDGSAWNYGRLTDPDEDRSSYLRDVDYVSGASIMLPRALLEELGGFDEAFAPCYYEDTDLAMRVRARGRRVLVQPLAKVTHYEGITAGTDVNEGPKRYQVINRETFFARWASTLEDHGAFGEEIELQKERTVRRRILVVDVDGARPRLDATIDRVERWVRRLRARDVKLTLHSPAISESGERLDSLRARGVEALTMRWSGSLDDHLGDHGALYDEVVLVSLDDARDLADRISALCPRATVRVVGDVPVLAVAEP
ncbi:MAG: glycosyltransferase family 2 protein, partial [Polyangiales bacterium]